MQMPDLQPIEQDDTFRFDCHCGVPCFNQCCRDLNQALTPYDVLRLKNHFKMCSRDFIRTYAVVYTGQSTGLPVVSLRFSSDQERNCPFVTPEGCSVYPDRPSSCRIYPLARALRRNRSDGKISEHFAVLRECHCLGFQEQASQTVSQWVASQELAVFHKMNDALLNLIALKNQLRPGPLSAEHQVLVQMAFYDIETLQQKALNGELPLIYADGSKTLPDKTDEEAWLKWGLAWITRVLFGDRQ